MTPEPWQKLQEMVDAAAELPVDARDALFDRECAGDPALRRQVESLIVSSKERHSYKLRFIMPLPGSPSQSHNRSKPH